MPFQSAKPNSQTSWAVPLDGLLLLMSAAAVWWVRQDDGPQRPLFPVAGQVLCEGLPAHEARVVFYPFDAQGFGRPLPAAHTAIDGRFQLGSGHDAGAPAGEYAVTIEWSQWIIDGEDYRLGPNILPRRFANPETTPLRAQVTPAINNLPPFRLTLCN